jgi:hypothetical protein
MSVKYILHFLFLIVLAAVSINSCSYEKYTLPVIPEDAPQVTSVEYIQLNSVLDAQHGYNFKNPADVYYGADNFLYVADTDNNRIVMLDLGGAVQGYSQSIEHPEAITQNDSLQLLIVSKSNKVFKLDLFAHNHNIASVPVEQVWEEQSYPNRQYTGISVHNGFEYYVTVIDESAAKPKSLIFDFYGNHLPKGPLPLNESGTGLFSALLPTSIISLREQYLDISSKEDTPAFIFTQTGFWEPLNLFNYYKVQHITTTVFEGQDVLTPNTSLVGTEFYDFEQFYNPEDAAIDNNGNIFIIDKGSADDGAGTVDNIPGFYRFGPSGRKLQSVTGYGPGAYQFKSPKGIAVSPSNELQKVYIADTGNNRIVQYQLSTDF